MFAYICVNMNLNTCNMSLKADYVDMNLKPQQKLNAEYKIKSQMVQGFILRNFQLNFFIFLICQEIFSKYCAIHFRA